MLFFHRRWPSHLIEREQQRVRSHGVDATIADADTPAREAMNRGLRGEPTFFCLPTSNDHSCFPVAASSA